LRERGAYLVGPLARFNLNFSRLPEIAQQAARDCGLAPPCRNPFRSIVVRAVELVFACHEALCVIAEYEPPPAPRVEMPGRAGVGSAATEAPRGLLYHRYEIDELLNGITTFCFDLKRDRNAGGRPQCRNSIARCRLVYGSFSKANRGKPTSR
jgi:coenzyme F420-reducing hydrogenase alpha subunit